jgi:hypothetical protein
MAKEVKVYEVLYHSDDPGSYYAGAAGDGSFIYRTRDAKEAARFATGKHCYGRPASVNVSEVPRRLAQRWGLA